DDQVNALFKVVTQTPGDLGDVIAQHFGCLDTQAGLRVETTEVLRDDVAQITGRLRHHLEQGVDLIVTVGGTGVHPGDQTVAAVRPLLDKELPGFMEAARGYGQRRTPYAMLSAGVAGMSGKTLLITFPGSSRGAQETLTALISGIVHTIHSLRRGG
ncbi:MAG: hypothetical protein E6Q76_10960, partial [Rhizobium sp.]